MRYDINLLTKKEFSLLDKSIFFFLNYLRYILVITQLVVIGVLFYRFKVDQDIIDLKESIDQKKEIIKVASPLLSRARKIDVQIMGVEQIISSQDRLKQAVDYIISVFPEKLFLSELAVQDTAIQLAGTALDPTQLQQFYLLLQKEKRFDVIKLRNIKRVGTGYEFIIDLDKFK